MQNISIAEAVEIINSIPNGRVFTVEFIKRTTGELRKMNCRKGVRKGVNGRGRNFDPKSKGLIGVFDMKIAQRVERLRMLGVDVTGDDGHRFISIEGIRSIKANGEEYSVDPTILAVS